MARTAKRSGWRHLASAAGIGLVLLAVPSAAFAADDPVTGRALSGVTADPGTATDAGIDIGPGLLLLVAGTLGLLGVLSGPEAAPPGRHPEARHRVAAR